MIRTLSRIEEIRTVLHNIAIKIIRDPQYSYLNRGRAFNLLAVGTAPEGSVNFDVTIPELPGEKLHLKLDLKDDLSRQWYYWGYDCYEPEVRQLMWELVKEMPLSEQVDIVDIGANLGYFALYLGMLLKHRGSGKVHAFEPSPPVLERLHRNLDLNKGLPVTLVEAALSDRDGYAPLFLADFATWGHSSASLLSGVVEQDNAVQVQTRSLDSYVDEHQVHRVALIKMDCEGAEAAAINSMKDLIQRDWPHIVLEIIPRFETAILPALNSEALSRYRKFHITDAGLVEHAACFASYEHRDWLLSVNPPEHLIVNQPRSNR